MKLQRILTAVALFFLILFSSLSASPSKVSFLDIPQKKLVGKLKGVAFATIRTSILKDYKFSLPKDIRYVPCPSDFPLLIGDFPCSLLSWDDEAVFVEETTSAHDAESQETEPGIAGGKVTVLLSSSKSPNLDGSVVKLGDDDDMLKLFYTKDGYISHYTFQSSVIIFKWRTTEKVKTLIGILSLKLDSNFFPVSGKEIDLQNP